MQRIFPELFQQPVLVFVGFLAIIGLWAWQLIVAWLLFKLGCYWGIWQNIARMRDLGPEMKTMDFMVAQSRRANVLTLTCLFSTLGNLLAAFLGVFTIMLLSWTFLHH